MNYSLGTSLSSSANAETDIAGSADAGTDIAGGADAVATDRGALLSEVTLRRHCV